MQKGVNMATKTKVKRVTIAEDNDKSAGDELAFIKQLASDVNSALKKDTIMVGEDAGDDGVPYWVRTGIPQLDYAVGGSNHPGFPCARITEIFGGEGVGKSTLAVWLMKQAMEQIGSISYYQDAERVLTPEIIRGTGINMDKVLRDQPDTIEEVFDAQDAILEVLKKKAPDKPVTIILDSIAACSTQAEIDGDMGDSQMASLARLMSKGLRKIKSPITESKVLSIWVNQIREKMNVSWGDNTTTSGGRAMAFFASVRVQLTKVKTLKKDKGDPYGCTIQAVIKKNKVSRPLVKAEYDILFIEDEKGNYPKIDVEGAVLDWCKEHKLIGGSTGRYELNGKSYYKDGARQELQQNPELYDDLVKMAYSVNPNLESEESDE